MTYLSSKKFALSLIAILSFVFLPNITFASTITCGSTVGGSGTELFSYNTSWYGHGCKFTTGSSIDVTAISAEISRIATTQTFALAIYANGSNKPTGSALATGNISSVTANCTVYTATVATTTLAAGTYWITAIPTTHSTAYICGAGSATVSDQDNTSAWATGYSGSYYLAATYTATPPPPPPPPSPSTTTPATPNYPVRFETFTGVTYTIGASLFLFFMVWQLAWIIEQLSGKKKNPGRPARR